MTDSENAIQEYLHIYQGYGGVYTFPTKCHNGPHKDKQLTAIGTEGCRTCVGVYIPLDDKRCFAAHISAFVGEYYAQQNSDECWCISPNEGQKLKDFTIKVLENTPGLSGLSCNDEAWYKRRKGSILVCPRQRRNGKPAVGTCILAALREFFKLGDLPVASGHGFGKDHISGEACLFKWQDLNSVSEYVYDGGANPSEKRPWQYGWEQMNVEPPGNAEEYFAKAENVGPWTFVLRNGEWGKFDAKSFEWTTK